MTELVEILEVPQPRVSRHLGVLREAGLVEDRREGNRTFYSVGQKRLGPFARQVWRAVLSGQEDESFFPEDLERVRDVLARRKARSKAYFDAVVSEWDRIKRNYIEDAVPFLVVANLLRPGELAVDIGTGTGEVLVALARAGARVIGVDSSEKMLAAARRRVAEAGLDNVELRLGDAEALPVADGECDTALASMVLHHLGDPATGVGEMARVVKGGGKVIVIDLVEHEQEWTREVMADVWLGFTEQQIRQWLEGAGLVDVAYSSSAVRSPVPAEAAARLRTFVAVATRPLE